MAACEDMISVIIPVYNAEGYLKTCVDSVCRQSFSNLQIILIDDGSTDHSGELCDALAAKDARILVKHGPNAGAAKARNIGVESADGNYLMFVDADDMLSDGICENLYQNLLDSHADCCICGYLERHKDSGKQIQHSVSAVTELSGKEALLLRYQTRDVAYNLVNPWGKLFRKEMWDHIRFTDGIYYEDMEVMPYLYLACRKIRFIPDIGYTYLVQEQSLSHGTNADERRVTDSMFIREKHLDFYESNHEKELAQYIRKSLLDLILTSELHDWLPRDSLEKAKRLFRKNWMRLFTGRNATVKEKIVYLIYRVGGGAALRRLSRRK